jgi:hypothetical protein
MQNQKGGKEKMEKLINKEVKEQWQDKQKP